MTEDSKIFLTILVIAAVYLLGSYLFAPKPKSETFNPDELTGEEELQYLEYALTQYEELNVEIIKRIDYLKIKINFKKAQLERSNQ